MIAEDNCDLKHFTEQMYEHNHGKDTKNIDSNSSDEGISSVLDDDSFKDLTTAADSISNHIYVKNKGESNIQSGESNSDDEDDDVFNSKRKYVRKSAIISDDDDDDDEGHSSNSDIKNKNYLLSTDSLSFRKMLDDSKSKISNEIDSSDSDEMDELNILHTNRIKKRATIHNSDSDISDSEFNSEGEEPKNDVYRSDLFDMDDDNCVHHSESRDSDNGGDKKVKIKKKSKQPNCPGDSKKAKQEIYSESQRLIRETQVSLPYHKPRQRTLREFLNRKKHNDVLQKGSLKMSMKDMNLLKEIELRKSEVPEFYKLDTSDEEDDIGPVMQLVPNVNSELMDSNESEIYLAKENSPSEDSVSVSNFHDASSSDALEQMTPRIEIQSNNILPDIPENTSGDKEVVGVIECLSEDLSKSTEEFKASVEKNSYILCDVNDFSENLDASIVKEFINTCTFSNKLQSESCEMESDKDLECTGVENIGMDKNVINDNDIDRNENNNENVESDFLFKEINDVKLKELKKDSKDVLESFLEIDEGDNNDNLILRLNTEDFLVDNQEENLNRDSGVAISIQDDGIRTKIDKGSKLDRLASRFPNLNLLAFNSKSPKIGSGLNEDDIIDLIDFPKCGAPQMNAGTCNLIERFVKHSNTKRAIAGKHAVSLTIVSKEKHEGSEEQLVQSKIEINLEGEDPETGEAVPGAKLSKLKNALRLNMMKQRKRDSLRREKAKLFMDTEYVAGEFPDHLLDNEEMTDQSDTDVEEESEPEENDVLIYDKKRKKNKFLEEEAEDDDDVDGEMADDEEDDSDEGEGNNDSVEENDDNSCGIPITEIKKVKKKIQLIDDNMDPGALEAPRVDCNEIHNNEIRNSNCSESEIIGQGLSRPIQICRQDTDDMFASQIENGKTVETEKSFNSMDASFELMGSIIPGYQPGGGLRGNKSVHCVNNSLSLNDSASMNVSRDELISSFTDDLVNEGNSLKEPLSYSLFSPLKGRKSPVGTTGLNFSFGDGLDSQNILDNCSETFKDTQPLQLSNLIQEDDVQVTQDYDMLAGLCSGHFTSQKVDSFAPTQSLSAFSDKFKSGSANDKTEENCHVERSRMLENNDSSLHSNSLHSKNEEFHVVNGESSLNPKSQDSDVIVIKKKKRKRILAMSDEEDSGGQNDDAISIKDISSDSDFDQTDEENVSENTSNFMSSKKGGGIRSDFFENEAELSGSEIGSEDEVELNEEEDLMEQEEGDKENFDQDELRDQVGRAHLKSIIDSDKREIRLLQEMYLEDGDLHGEGRQRQFRWRNVDDDGVSIRDVSEDEGEEEDVDEEDAKWRKERFEREKFLQEQEEKKVSTAVDVLTNNENGVTRQSSLKLVRSKSLRDKYQNSSVKDTSSKVLASSIFNRSMSTSGKHGSFLTRDSETLKRLAEFTKDNTAVVGGAKQGGNFVFQTLTAEEVEAKCARAKETKLNPNKKIKVDRSFFSMDKQSISSSIFKHF